MPMEPTVLNLTNAEMLAPHLLCAASESPLLPSDARFFATPPLSLPHDRFAATAAAKASSAASCAVAGHAGAVADDIGKTHVGQHEDGEESSTGWDAGTFWSLVRQLVDKGHYSLGCLEPLDGEVPCADTAGGGDGLAKGKRWAFVGGPKPQRNVSLRSIDDKRWSLQVLCPPDLSTVLHVRASETCKPELQLISSPRRTRAECMRECRLVAQPSRESTVRRSHVGM